MLGSCLTRPRVVHVITFAGPALSRAQTLCQRTEKAFLMQFEILGLAKVKSLNAFSLLELFLKQNQ